MRRQISGACLGAHASTDIKPQYHERDVLTTEEMGEAWQVTPPRQRSEEYRCMRLRGNIFDYDANAEVWRRRVEVVPQPAPEPEISTLRYDETGRYDAMLFDVYGIRNPSSTSAPLTQVQVLEQRLTQARQQLHHAARTGNNYWVQRLRRGIADLERQLRQTQTTVTTQTIF